MNKNLFRIIFNKRRGQLMAVAETSSSQGKGSIGETSVSGEQAIVDNATVGISGLSFAVLCALGAVLWALPTPNARAQVVAYGPLQIAADTGVMKGFMDGLRSNPSEEAQSFYKELQAAGGVTASQNKDPAFIQTWMKLTAKDPQFIQYQIDALVNQDLYPVVQELQKAGIDFNSLSQSQKEALFSAAVQHGAGTVSKTKGADNVLERSMSVAQTDAQPPSLPTYTRQELVYGQVEDQMRSAEEAQAKLITQRESLITQRESLITQQLQLERQKSQLFEQGLNSDATQVQSIKNQAAALDNKINMISAQVNDITGKVDGVTQKVNAQNQYIEEARQYLKSQAQGSLTDGEQWLKDFYQQRTQMYPAEASRYKKELDSLLKQYREEQLNKGAK